MWLAAVVVVVGMVMGYRVADWPLFKTGFLNELKMAFAAYCIGCCFGVVLGDVGKLPTCADCISLICLSDHFSQATRTSGPTTP